MIRVCFVCLGNICRSPTAHGVMEHLVRERGLEDRVHVGSAGTGGWHVGEPADGRARETARRRGFELTSRAETFEARDFDRYDYVLAMDKSNLANLRALARRDDDLDKLTLFRSYDPEASPGAEVPDPYYGGPDGFEDVFDMCERACHGLLVEIEARLD